MVAHPDYLTDARLLKVQFTSLKKFVKEKECVPDRSLWVANTKFALVCLAEQWNIALEPILEKIGPYEAPDFWCHCTAGWV